LTRLLASIPIYRATRVPRVLPAEEEGGICDEWIGRGALSARKAGASLIARGLSNKQIAITLDPPASESTVKEHLRRIFQKLDVQNRTELAAMWLAHLRAEGGA
jgi:DNA-binding NarL/FixJ family response regulator